MSEKSENKTPSTFVSKIDLNLSKKLIDDLVDQGFEISTPQYTVVSGKKQNLVCTLYHSGKLVVQGKGMDEFIEFYLEPQILQSMQYTNKKAYIVPDRRIGVDESGKGDFFGPLCIAGVCAGGDEIAKLVDLGVRDSKKINDIEVIRLSNKIQHTVPHHVVRINPKKYNELYAKFKNLNSLLAWGHATIIENLVEKTGCQTAIIDQFASEHVVITALKRKKMEITLNQRHRGEEDPVVAAASILARAAFLNGLYQLRKDFDTEFPKGASSEVLRIGKQFVERRGPEALYDVSKVHFKTYGQIVPQ